MKRLVTASGAAALLGATIGVPITHALTGHFAPHDVPHSGPTLVRPEFVYREPPHTDPDVRWPTELAPYRPMGTATTPPGHSPYLAGTFNLGGTMFVVATGTNL
jgi:hypothetical protein